MFRYFLSLLIFLSFSNTSFASALPYSSSPVNGFTPESEIAKGFTRLKISLAIGELNPENSIRLGRLNVCTKSACFSPPTPGYFNAINTANGSATLVVDAIVPSVKIESVYFSEITGAKVVDGNIKLRTPLALEEGYYGGEILIILSRRSNGKNEIYYPSDSSSNFFNKESQSVYYNPKIAMTATLSHATIFFLPVGALETAQIFSVGIHDNGNKHPLVDIFPYVNFIHNGSLETAEIDRSKEGMRGDGAVTPTPAPMSYQMHSQSAKSAPTPNQSRKIKKTIPKTGVFSNSDTDVINSSENQKEKGISATAAQSCAEIISNPVNLNGIRSAASGSGVVNVNWCENIPPYIHIAYINTSDPRVKYSIPLHDSKFRDSAGTGPYFFLKRITDSGANSIVSINGFTWSGDLGIVSGGDGTLDGYVTSNGQVKANNTIGGGTTNICTLLYPCFNTGQKFVMGYGRDFSNLAFFDTSDLYVNFGNSGFNVISSSTSVVKNGVCQTPGTSSRWSAIGAGPGQMVMMSSVSGSSTTAADLCPIFKSFQIQNALRLDGGPSAAIMIDSNVKNPLVGLDYLRYGSLRYIAYPLRFSK
ncbi:hypothetical protein [Duganella violaceipulchra]|uniref:Phosphodiester glycosidase domain-containing protein n=1 Tax=Duganella violaceipulchra TaxID=2849652 RepID=A0AA41H5Y3_9BURK|nr:hypothetical protein [Duganella violaceicalia]MBV6322417.1 hypothetical protein [Duganella violaceicalia]MCP2011563.1 hypothetical protein [Duganella violaceicalia]